MLFTDKKITLRLLKIDRRFGSKRLLFSLILSAILIQGCASQSGFSNSLPQRLTQTQNVWYARSHGNPNMSLSVQSGTGDLQGSLQQVLDRLVYVSPLRGYPIRLVVVPDPKVNAHTDGNAIYINSGLLTTFRYQDDLVASVMAHELGHILANHQPEGQKRSSSLSYLSYLTPALSALPYGSLYGSVASTALNQGVQIRQYSYGRLQENEADAIGVFIAADAGYNAMGLSQFLDYAGGSGFSAPKSISIPTSVGAIPESAFVTLLSSSPLYQTHPRSEKRKKIVELILQRKKGLITQAELQDESQWVADLYTALEMSKPKI